MSEFDDTWKDVHVHKKRAEVKDLSFEVSDHRVRKRA